jgi:PAS domain S-box-containing protein
MDENRGATRILVVDDNDLLRHITGQILTNAGYDCIEAATGLAGVARAQVDQPDLILLDLMLPDIDGSEVCRRLKADPATARIHILVITAFDADATYRVAVLDAGADGYLLRPIPTPELLARIEALLRLKRVEDDLRRAEARFREIYEHAAVGIFQSTPAGRFISVNPAMARIYGYDAPAEMIACVGDQIAARVYHDEATRAEFMRLLHQADVLTGFEALHRRKDGRLIWTHTNARTVRDAGGAVQYYEGFVEDITRRKQLESLIQLQCELGVMLAEAKDLCSVLHQVLETVCRIEGIDCGGVYLADPSTGALDLAAHRGLSAQFVALATHYDPAARHVRLACAGRPIYGRHEVISGFSLAAQVGERLRGLAVIPICHEGQVIAVLNLASHTHDEIPPDTRVALEAVAAQIGGALARLRAEAMSRQSQDNLQALFDTMDDLVFIIEADGGILGANAAARVRLGYTALELVGMKLLDLHPQEVRAEAAGILARMLRGETDVCLLPVQARDGTTFVAESRITHGRWSGQDVIFGITRDITERQRAEAALRASEARYRTLAEAAHDMIFVINPQGQVEYVNRFAAAQFGRTPEEIIGRAQHELFPPQVAERQWQSLQKVLATGQPLYAENPSVLADREIWLGTWLAPIEDAGQVRAVLGVARDLTERKRADAALARQAEELARSNAELEQFAYAASHDLQEPLRMVASFVGLLADRYQGQLDSDADEFIEFAVDGARRMQALISDLLEYSRVTTRGQPPQPTDAAAVLAEALWNLGLAIAEAGATVTHDPLPTVLADPTQLMRLFQNLIGNALKFRSAAPPVVHVSVELRNAECGIRNAGQGPQSAIRNPQWLFSVRDNGIGIDPQNHARIFGVFQRLHTRQEYPGTGIGLAICQKIVERHGGRIWVASQEGQGATFYFTLPAA